MDGVPHIEVSLGYPFQKHSTDGTTAAVAISGAAAVGRMAAGRQAVEASATEVLPLRVEVTPWK